MQRARRLQGLVQRALTCQKSVTGCGSVPGRLLWQDVRLCPPGAGPVPSCTRGFATLRGGGEAGEGAAKAAASRRGPVSYLSLGLTLATAGGVAWYFEREKRRRIADRATRAQSVGVAAIGGPFELVDAQGRPFTDRDLHGEHALLYFGFTHCPDICPEELEKLAKVVTELDKDPQTRVQPVFISIDPERDDVAAVAKYVRQFHPRLLGLTGSPDQVRAAARAYRVYYTKTNEDPKDYLVDHSIITYLLDPGGCFVNFYGKQVDAEQLEAAIRKEIAKWRESQPSTG